MKASVYRDRVYGQYRPSGHSMGSYRSPMAFGLRYRSASPHDELSTDSLPRDWRWILNTFFQADCDTCLLVSAERHGRAQFPIKSAAGKNVFGSQLNRGVA